MGTAFIDGFTASVTAGVLGDQSAPKQAQAAPKPAAPAPAPTPKVVAEAPKPATEPPKQAVAAAPVAPAQAVAVSMPVQQAAKAPETPKSAPAPALVAMKESPKPEPVAKQEPAPAPVKEASEPAPVKEASRVPVRLAAGPVYESKIRFNDLVTAVLYQDAGTVNDLLAFGKWPDKADSTGMTPLMIAISLGQAEIAQALLKAGADPQRVGPGGVTAIPIARERRDAALLGLLQGRK
jgi:hypothetical protein